MRNADTVRGLFTEVPGQPDEGSDEAGGRRLERPTLQLVVGVSELVTCCNNEIGHGLRAALELGDQIREGDLHNFARLQGHRLLAALPAAPAQFADDLAARTHPQREFLSAF